MNIYIELLDLKRQVDAITKTNRINRHNVKK
jgi:hypothetical protein